MAFDFLFLLFLFVDEKRVVGTSLGRKIKKKRASSGSLR